MSDLSGRRALVTGAAIGIGRALASELARANAVGPGLIEVPRFFWDREAPPT